MTDAQKMKLIPKVSIIIPNYNSELFLEECLQSCHAQSYENIEILLIDDGSTDRSIHVASQYINQNTIVIRQENKGAPAARNVGIQKSTGFYLKFLDSDDILLPDAIEKQVQDSENTTFNDIIYGNYSILKHDSKSIFCNSITSSYTLNEILKIDILTSTPLHKRAHLIEIGGFDERIKRGQEWNLHARLVASGKRFIHKPTDVFYYREHNLDTRISNMQKEIGYSLNSNYEKLYFTFEAISSSADEECRSHFANSLWYLGRLAIRCRNEEVANQCFITAKKISPNNYKSLQPGYYKILNLILGIVKTEMIIKNVSKLIRGRL